MYIGHFLKNFSGKEKNVTNIYKAKTAEFKKQSQHQNVEVFVWVSYNEGFSSVDY